VARRPRKRVAKRRAGKRSTRSAQLESRVVPRRPKRLNNLPVQLTAFIGREHEITDIKGLLASTRLLTLTGAGGAGKTRLALQVAADSFEQFADGVWFVDLAPVADPAFVPNSVVAALDVPEEPTRPLTDTLTDYLRTKILLLVLDNCEHLQGACQNLADHLLRASTSLRMLATSRVALGVEGESTYRVPPLELPDVGHVPPVAQLARYDAIRLFAERATLSRSGFAITAGNAPAVLQICQRLDAMPLAIEFAAARVAALSVDQIATRLDDRFRLLTAEPRKTLRRQQTLRATLDWSHDLLSPPEQVLFRRLAVFAGGFAVEAAEKICAGTSVGERDILDLLTNLVNKSLIVFDELEGRARYRLLDSVRQYGRDKLQESGETELVLQRHRDWYLQFAEEANPKLRGREQDVWLDRLETEHDNLRAALAWNEASPDAVDGRLRLAGALWWFWYMNGHWSEGRKWLDDMLSAGRAAKPSLFLKVLQGAGVLAYQQGDIDRMRDLVKERWAVAQKLGDKEGSIGARFMAANLALELGEVDRAIPLQEEALALAREFGDTWFMAMALGQLADGVRMQGDHERAASLNAESVRLFEELGDKWRLSVALRNMGSILLRQRDYGRAAKFYADSLGTRDPAKNRWMVYQNLEELACVASARKDYERAAILFGAAKPIQESLRSRREPDLQAELERYTKATRTSLGESAFARALAEGRAMTLEQAIEYALTSVETAEEAAQRRRSQRSDGGALTVREREIVALVARGLTNRQIAETLVVSRRTADAHVQNILNKLGFSSRAQIAAWAGERGLSGSPEGETVPLRARSPQSRRTT
jgi:non-specific serine/threonine protein kinase